MIGHSLARDGPTRWKVDLTLTACVLAASGLSVLISIYRKSLRAAGVWKTSQITRTLIASC